MGKDGITRLKGNPSRFFTRSAPISCASRIEFAGFSEAVQDILFDAYDYLDAMVGYSSWYLLKKSPKVYEGHTHSRTVPVATSELGQRCHCRHGDTACFHHPGEWTENNGLLTVQFQPTIYINSALTGRARTDALRHEQGHYTDFRRRANQLQHALAGAVRAHRDPQMDARWRWFL